MKVKRVTLRNFGPIARSELGLKTVNVFYGPNNSGKSMAARLLYGLTRSLTQPTIELERERYLRRRFSRADIQRYWMLHRDRENTALRTMRMVNEEVPDVVRVGEKSCVTTIETDVTRATIRLRKLGGRTFDLRADRGFDVLRRKVRLRRARRGKDAIYIPAARTGTIQFFSSILYMRNQLLRDIIQTFGGTGADKVSPTDLRRFLLSLGRFPLYLEDFYDFLLEILARGDITSFEEDFQLLHSGIVNLRKTEELELPSLVFVDPSGFQTEIERAGSGVVASLPIILAAREVESGGTLVVEEPEVHLEPRRQMILVDSLCRSATHRKVTLVLTTHSEFVVQKILGLVSRGVLKNSNIGLFFFDRKGGKPTEIKEIRISKRGEAEQPLFNEAVESLTRDFSAVR